MIVPRAVLAAMTVAGAVVAVWWLVPPIAQDLAYHRMADERPMLGVPNGLNVLSNAAFLVVGLMGLAIVLGPRSGSPPLLASRWERWPYGALFAGAALTAFGSTYYHLAPDNARLVWDRLPMTLGFMGLLTAVVAERVSVRVGRRLFGPLLVIGAASVGYWHWTELRGAGDLRPYALVQFGSLFGILVLVLSDRGRYTGSSGAYQRKVKYRSMALNEGSGPFLRNGPLYVSTGDPTRYLIAGLGVYAVSKLFEWADAPIFAWGRIVSGHTLKHLTAAIAVGCVVAMLRKRHTAIP